MTARSSLSRAFRSTLRTVSCAAAAWVALGLVPASAQATQLEAEKLFRPEGTSFASFGRAIALQGNFALIGGNGIDTHGAVACWQKIGGVWTETQKFTGSDTLQGDFFGFDVAMEFPYLVVGASQHETPFFNGGAAYVFEFVAGQWVEVQKLVAPDTAASDKFGSCVALAGDLIVVGAAANSDDGASSGSAYVWRRNGATWAFEQKLTASTADAGDQFGWDVDTDGAQILVSAIEDEVDAAPVGAIFPFTWNGSSWVEGTRIVPSDGVSGDRFGWDFDLDGDGLAVGATQHGPGGALYVFRNGMSGWTEEQKLTPTKLQTGAILGFSVALRGDRLVGGAPGTGSVFTGALYHFHFDGTRWVEVHEWLNTDPGTVGFPASQMGMSCALWNKTVMGGAPFADGAASKDGVVWRYDLTDLGLEAPTEIAAGETLELHTWGGLAGDLMGVLLYQVNGVTFNVVFGFDLFDANGEELFSIPLSPTTAGFQVTFLTGGYWQDGVLAASNTVTTTIF